MRIYTYNKYVSGFRVWDHLVLGRDCMASLFSGPPSSREFRRAAPLPLHYACCVRNEGGGFQWPLLQTICTLVLGAWALWARNPCRLWAHGYQRCVAHQRSVPPLAPAVCPLPLGHPHPPLLCTTRNLGMR